MVTAPNLISLVVATAQVVLMFTVDGITEAGAGSSSSEPPLCSAVRRATLCASDELADLTLFAPRAPDVSHFRCRTDLLERRHPCIPRDADPAPARRRGPHLGRAFDDTLTSAGGSPPLWMLPAVKSGAAGASSRSPTNSASGGRLSARRAAPASATTPGCGDPAGPRHPVRRRRLSRRRAGSSRCPTSARPRGRDRCRTTGRRCPTWSR